MDADVRAVVFDARPDITEITIRTHCPDKWLFIDRETGDVWRWDERRKTLVRA